MGDFKKGIPTKRMYLLFTRIPGESYFGRLGTYISKRVYPQKGCTFYFTRMPGASYRRRLGTYILPKV